MEFGFKYFYELVIGTLLAVFVGFQSWLAMRVVKHGQRLAQIDVERMTRADFEAWAKEQVQRIERMHEENQMQMDELRASSIASGQQAVEMMKDTSEKLEAQLRHGIDKMEDTQKQILFLLAKQGIKRDD